MRVGIGNAPKRGVREFAGIRSSLYALSGFVSEARRKIQEADSERRDCGRIGRIVRLLSPQASPCRFPGSSTVEHSAVNVLKIR
jgi:hypothetical protein